MTRYSFVISTVAKRNGEIPLENEPKSKLNKKETPRQARDDKKMKKDFNFYVYIMASSTGTLYIGFTSDIRRRVTEHKNDLVDGFSKKYKCHKLVYYEHYKYVNDAIVREKQLKKWNRQKKEVLINKINSKWEDLAYDL